VFSGISVSALAKPPTDQPCGDEFTENLTFFGKFPQQACAETLWRKFSIYCPIWNIGYQDVNEAIADLRQKMSKETNFL
jgi:hypothetical protein